VRRRLLFLLPFPPDPDGLHGSSRVTGQLLQTLASRHDVATVYLRAPDEPGIGRALRDGLALTAEVRRPALEGPGHARRTARRAWGLVAGRPTWVTDWAVPEFGSRVAQVAAEWRPDVVQAELHVMGQYLAGLAGLSPRVLVEYDPGAAAAADLASWERGLRRAGRRVDALAWRRYERRVLAEAEALVAFTDEDRAALAELAPAASILRIAPGIVVPEQPADPTGGEPAGVLFLGSFVHPPNVEAAIRLAHDIFPAVRARLPEATLEIVGAAPPPAVRELEGDGIVVTGRVDDTWPFVDRAAVVAAPLRLGGGMRVKVLETLAAGKALVATPRALAGLPLVAGKHALVGDTDTELADALVALLRDPNRRRGMADAARAWATEELAWERTAVAYEALYASLLEGGAR
jgi:polysaccharide biosynthesis protein PslH